MTIALTFSPSAHLSISIDGNGHSSTSYYQLSARGRSNELHNHNHGPSVLLTLSPSKHTLSTWPDLTVSWLWTPISPSVCWPSLVVFANVQSHGCVFGGCQWQMPRLQAHHCPKTDLQPLSRQSLISPWTNIFLLATLAHLVNVVNGISSSSVKTRATQYCICVYICKYFISQISNSHSNNLPSRLMAVLLKFSTALPSVA